MSHSLRKKGLKPIHEFGYIASKLLGAAASENLQYKGRKAEK